MNKTIATMILFAAATCALAATGDDAQKPSALSAKPQTVSLPKDSVANPDGSYSWTDQHGKKWIYRKTAMGLNRYPATPVQTERSHEIPKDAVKSSDGSYLWSDTEGKKWRYRETPFGVTKTPLTAESAAGSASSFSKIVDKGDTVRFERLGPGGMGVSAYEKKKSELNDEERRLYNAAKAKSE